MISMRMRRRGRGGWDPRQLITWSVMALGLGISLWQGWTCTHLYLAQPVRVETQFAALAHLQPPIQLSLCRVFSIDHRVNPKGMSVFGRMPTFANNTNSTAAANATFWRQLEALGERFQLWDFVAEIGFWNETAAAWDLVYGKTIGDTSALDLAVYPYEGNSSLLCHTLREGLATWGTRFRLVTAAALEASRYFKIQVIQ